MTAKSKRLIILGAGGHGRVVADIAEQQGFSDIAFVDDTATLGQSNLHWKVIGRSIIGLPGKFSAFVAIGNNSVRMEKLAALAVAQIEVPILVHTSAVVSKYAAIGAGTVVMPNVVINAGARLGQGVIANSGCTIDHDCFIGDGAHISPGANLAGGVSVGDRSWIGIGACVREGLNVGKDVTIGAGAVVISNVMNNTTVFGVPAQVKRT